MPLMSVSWFCAEPSICGSFFFFFQAEDGIRDYKVTGVQTCALPIFSNHMSVTARVAPGLLTVNSNYEHLIREHSMLQGIRANLIRAVIQVESAFNPRSEERRVGKECRSRWSPYH